jgi:hypothetical protein
LLLVVCGGTQELRWSGHRCHTQQERSLVFAPSMV